MTFRMKVLFFISGRAEKIMCWADQKVWDIVYEREYSIDELNALLDITPPGYVRFRILSMIAGKSEVQND